MNDTDTALRILNATRRIAVVGASDNPMRDSHRIMAYLLRQGYDVLPVNPNARRVLERDCVARLTDLRTPVDTVVCFRRSEDIGPIADDAIAIGARHLWMQYGIVNEAAARLARAAGMLVVMDRCIMVDHRRFGLAGLAGQAAPL